MEGQPKISTNTNFLHYYLLVGYYTIFVPFKVVKSDDETYWKTSTWFFQEVKIQSLNICNSIVDFYTCFVEIPADFMLIGLLATHILLLYNWIDASSCTICKVGGPHCRPIFPAMIFHT